MSIATLLCVRVCDFQVVARRRPRVRIQVRARVHMRRYCSVHIRAVAAAAKPLAPHVGQRSCVDSSLHKKWSAFCEAALYLWLVKMSVSRALI